MNREKTIRMIARAHGYRPEWLMSLDDRKLIQMAKRVRFRGEGAWDLWNKTAGPHHACKVR